ncbi:ArpU family phage packaging/lysis transcriptional regulator [Paenibacillus senegalimassiliensis]|uniref:ArpU family phage packaging/lysis transcriptional regulator n=1 Tax=Paenibacillus senegalimassiliensis TaxID=1737426 RepID=UPI00073E3AF5|nr:ArpU family phage packaging/lysis transcriptional regulator [Paenibacillus senegalimassiliensis]
MGRRRIHVYHALFSPLPVDETATRAAVERRLEEVRQYRQIGLIRQEAFVTAKYEPRYQGGGGVSNPTERLAIMNADKEAELIRKSELLELAMERLSEDQQEVIGRSYLSREGEYDFISCGEMGISDRTYRRIKASAIRLLAAAMGLEVYEKEERSRTEHRKTKHEVG